MTKNLPAVTNQDKRVAEVLRLHHVVLASASQMAVAAAKAGLEFKALKKECGHGNWEGFFETHFAKEITLRTAQRYMALADGLKGKALKNDTGMSFLKLLDSAPSELSKGDQEKLTKAVAKVTDGATLSELYQDLGIAKKPQGAAAKGGAKTKTVGSAEGDAGGEEDDSPAQSEAQVAKANTERLIALLEEAKLDKKFHAASKELRKKLHGLLVDLQEEVGGTLK